ncbi:hypothetical protein BGZ58_004442, partial [Dissophora ornata]
MLPAQADTALQSRSPALTTSPHIPAPILASNVSPLRLSPQTTPPGAQSTTPTYTALLSPSTLRHFYFTEPYQWSEVKVDGRKCNSRKKLKQMEAERRKKDHEHHIRYEQFVSVPKKLVWVDNESLTSLGFKALETQVSGVPCPNATF